MRLRVVAFLWVLCVQLIYSQSYVELFKESIPNSILENPEFSATVDKNLEYYSSISPKLVYFYIEHLNRKYDQQIADPDSNHANYLSDLTSRMLLLRNQWVLSEKEIIANSSDNKIAQSKSKTIIEEYFNDNVSLLDYGADTNKVYYFYLKFLNKLNSEAYDPTINYFEEFSSIALDKVNYLKNIYYGYEREELESKELLEFVLENKFLFKNSINREIPIKTDFTFGEMLLKIYSPSSLENYQIYLFAEGLYEGYEFEDKIAIAETLGTTNSIVNIEEIINNDIAALIDLGVGAKVKLKDQKSFLSHVDLTGSISVIKFLQEPENFPRSATRRYANSSVQYLANYFISEPENKSLLSLKFNASFPVHYFNSYISGGLGLEYRYLKYSYDLKTSRTVENLGGIVQDAESYSKTDSFEHAENRFSALAYFDFEFSKLITLRLQYKTPNVASLTIRVGPSL